MRTIVTLVFFESGDSGFLARVAMRAIAKRSKLAGDNCSMKTCQTLITLLISVSAATAWGAGNALWQAEQSCIKYPTPSARSECEKKLKEDQAAFEKEQKKKKDDAKRTDGTPTDARKKNDLCFKRETTGETVCPN